jgi:outer membrane protein TolC
MPELTAEALVEQVLTRNPSLGQMIAAWQAASARFLQVTSLDDPMFTGMIAPASFGSNTPEPGYRVELSQKLPFPGKLDLRGQAARAEARAAGDEVDDLRLQLTESARSAFAEYYLVHQALAVNREGLELMREFRDSAESRYKANLVTQQDVLQAEVEIGRQRERGLTLKRMQKTVAARINTLMHLPPDAPLPPPPKQLPLGPSLPSRDILRHLALSQRADLRAVTERLAADQVALASANREYCPDIEAVAAYDTMMGNGPLRDLAPQIGIRMNLPCRQARRGGAVAEAQARVAQRRAELDARTDQVTLQVEEAYEQVRESEQVVRLYDQTILPAARRNVEAARSAYRTGKIPFLTLIEAQRNLVNLRDRWYEAQADYLRRRATLERVTGGPLPSLPHPPVR